MTDTESKEVKELAKDLKEIRECEIQEHCILLDGEVAKKLYAKGYTKRPQDRCKTGVEKVSVTPISPQANNALVPLDVMAMRDCGQEAVRKELNQTHSWKLIRIVCEAIYAKFGKDNSGMVGLDISKLIDEQWAKKVFIEEFGLRSQQADYVWGFIVIHRIGFSKFSQQPPEERKVSLEEIFNIIDNMVHGYSKTWKTKVAQAILNLLNATEERKGE